MNINSMINKILLMLANQKGKIYKYNIFKFYSEQTSRYSSKHQLLERKLIRTKKGIQEKYIEVKSSYSNRDILEYLMEETKRME